MHEIPPEVRMAESDYYPRIITVSPLLSTQNPIANVANYSIPLHLGRARRMYTVYKKGVFLMNDLIEKIREYRAKLLQGLYSGYGDWRK